MEVVGFLPVLGKQAFAGERLRRHNVALVLVNAGTKELIHYSLLHLHAITIVKVVPRAQEESDKEHESNGELQHATDEALEPAPSSVLFDELILLGSLLFLLCLLLLNLVLCLFALLSFLDLLPLFLLQALFVVDDVD